MRDAWKQERSDYAGKWSEEETDEQSRERYRKQREWEQSALAALTRGEITPEEASTRGVHEAKDFKPVPEVPLYHVTTALSAVLAEGLKSRYELNLDAGPGLGGGTSHAISFTPDLAVAKGIYSALLEAKQILGGKLPPEELLAKAKEGEGASRPYLVELVRWGGSYFGSNEWSPGQPYPIHLRAFLEGKKIVDSRFGRWLQEENPGCEPVPGHEGWVGGDGKTRYQLWQRPLTPEEKQDMTWDLFKTFLATREHAGGKLNPLFFNTDTDKLAQVSIADIAILKCRTTPGTMGTYVTGLDEWRVYDGATVTIEQVLR